MESKYGKNKNRPSFSKQELEIILDKAGGHCHVCHKELTVNTVEVDHVVPWVEKWDNDIRNFLPACRKCNRLLWGWETEIIQNILEWGTIIKSEINNKTDFGKEFEKLLVKKKTILQKRQEGYKNIRTARIDELRQHYQMMSKKDVARRLTQVLDWAEEKSYFRSARNKNKSFSIGPNSTKKFITLFDNGDIYFLFNVDKNYDGDVTKRNRLAEKLKILELLDREIDPNTITEKRILKKRINELDDLSLEKLLKYLEESCESAPF